MDSLAALFEILSLREKNLWNSMWNGLNGSKNQQNIRNKIRKKANSILPTYKDILVRFYQRFAYETLPEYVKKILRTEVGFVCSVEQCLNPVLTWHHFDPPQRDRKHNDPSGMIALCPTHHGEADGGPIDPERIRKLKQQCNNKPIRKRIEWFRNDIVVSTIGGLNYDIEIILSIEDCPIIFFNRDEDGNFLLNIHLSMIAGQSLVIKDNWLIEKGNPEDFVCPPHGQLLRI